MPGILDLIEDRGDGPILAGSGVAVADVVDRLEAGENAEAVRRSLGLHAGDVVAAIASAALGAGPDDGPPLVRSRPTRPRLVAAVSERNLVALFPDADRPSLLALQAGLLQMLDSWEPSHTAAQEADDRGERTTSQYWHGIAHRREPDPGNASYWFRRVGRHPDFTALAEAARPILAGAGDEGLAARLLRDGWDPFAFIEACTSARSGSPTAGALGRVQRQEMAILLSTSLRHVDR
ncbi:hypothetical protein [Tautonia sociabilis]|uniref:Uncharacterized protein n=1 Tax=Tautonia sociabilis TaxID=2080755 RepID=A0A432MHC7_9BACT|nr:hypothetical protein [Tautonia sociabilis]RUL86711.1 hypothetical protein TsocGM_15485 [Tautonia sociabilis]